MSYMLPLAAERNLVMHGLTPFETQRETSRVPVLPGSFRPLQPFNFSVCHHTLLSSW